MFGKHLIMVSYVSSFPTHGTLDSPENGNVAQLATSRLLTRGIGVVKRAAAGNLPPGHQPDR